MLAAHDTRDTPGVGLLLRIKIERLGFERLVRRGASWRSFSRQGAIILLNHGAVLRGYLGGGAEGRPGACIAVEFPPDVEFEVLEARDDRCLQLVGAARIGRVLQPAQLPDGLVQWGHIDALSGKIASQRFGALDSSTDFTAELPGITHTPGRVRSVGRRAPAA